MGRSVVLYGHLQQQRRRVGTETKTFRYTEPYSNHYKFRHAVDDHNNHRHSDISLEETWVTHHWENRVFAFLLAITEVNLFLLYRYFIWKEGDNVPLLQFRRQLAKALINNDDLSLESPRRSKRVRESETDHYLVRAPHHAQKYFAGKWSCKAKDKYQKYVCRSDGCNQRIRTSCKCSLGQWMCVHCFAQHSSSNDGH